MGNVDAETAVSVSIPDSSAGRYQGALTSISTATSRRSERGIRANDARSDGGTAALILVVDDAPGQAERLADVLSALGIPAVAALSADAAWEHLLENSSRYALVLSHVRMVGITGYELMAAVRHRVPSLPVVLYTMLPLLPDEFETAPILENPFSIPVLVRALAPYV